MTHWQLYNWATRFIYKYINAQIIGFWFVVFEILKFVIKLQSQIKYTYTHDKECHSSGISTPSENDLIFSQIAQLAKGFDLKPHIWYVVRFFIIP